MQEENANQQKNGIDDARSHPTEDHSKLETPGAGGKPKPGQLAYSQLKGYVRSLALPAPISIGSLILAAFLIFPAYRGFTSARRILELEGQMGELQKTLDSQKARFVIMERELSQRDILLRQRQRTAMVSNEMGLLLSPLLSLEPKKRVMPDLINVTFSRADRAVLVFVPPKGNLEEVEVSILQGERLVWNQIVVMPKESAGDQSLLAFILTHSVLIDGKYQLVVEGNPTKRRVAIAQFDLSVES